MFTIPAPTETQITTKKAGPTDELFPVVDGKINREGRVAVWSSKNGKAKSFRINGQLYVQFPVKPKA
jgi:hypothetical protein